MTPGEAAGGTAPSGEIPESVREQVLTAYGAPAGKGYLVCRLIPEALGGTTSAANVFPVTPWFADLKARLDRELAQKVRAGKLTRRQAQDELRANWVDAAHRHYVRNYGLKGAEARRKEDALNWRSE